MPDTRRTFDPPPNMPKDPIAFGVLAPFLPCPAQDADRDDYLSALRVLNERILLDGAEPMENVTPITRDIGLDRLDRSGLPLESVVEILEYLADYIAISPPEVGALLRLAAEQNMRRRFDRDAADDLLRRYVDPPPPGEPPYDDTGLLRSVDLSEARDVSWLVEGLIPVASVGLWVAPFSSGKTFGAAALGLALAHGRDWMGQPTNDGGHVRYIAAEGLARFDRRLAGWLVHHGALPETFTRAALADALDGRFSLSGGGLRLDDPRLEEVLVRTLKEDGTRLLVLDTLGRLLGVGQSDEDNAAANAVMGVLHRVAAATGCTILVVHHPGHTQTHRARGASAWQQAADWVLVSKGNLKSGAPVRLINTKQRDGELFDDAAYRLRKFPVFCDGERWPSAVFEPADVSETEDLPVDWRVRYAVQAHPGASMREIQAVVKGRKEETGDTVRRLVMNGLLDNRGSGNGYSLYDAPEKWPVETPGDVPDVFGVDDPSDFGGLSEESEV